MMSVADDAAAPVGPGPKLDTTVSHSARIWNYWLGGKDNYAVDREAGDRVAAMLPSIVAQARADRAFLGRAIRYLAGEAGIRQFLDIGTGLPTANNTHEVAQRVAPESRIVYADNDPLVLAHAAGRLAPHPRHRPGVLDRQEADGGGATGQLPGRQPLDERRPRRGHGGGGAALEQGRHAVHDAAHTGADRPFLRRPRAARARRLVVLALAARTHVLLGPAGRGGRVLRRRTQAVTGGP